LKAFIYTSAIALTLFTGSAFGQTYNPTKSDEATRNTASGTFAVPNNSGKDNTGIGHRTMPVLTTGIRDTATGSGAGAGLTTGQENSLYGYRAGTSLKFGSANTMMGADAGWRMTNGTSNTILGYSACNMLTTGANNTCIGAGAGAAVTGIGNVIIEHPGKVGESYGVHIGSAAHTKVTVGAYDLADFDARLKACEAK